LHNKDYIMTHIDYFKLQAKNLLKDFKTKHKIPDNVVGYLYDYNPKYFDVNELVLSFDIDEEKKFSLMNAQHYIAILAGFDKWSSLINSSDDQLELARLLFENQDRLSLDDWDFFMGQTEEMNNRK